MLGSMERMLTTHTGSLPRGTKLTELLVKEEQGDTVDHAAMYAEMEQRVAHVLRKQKEAGIDIPNDGEQPRVGFQTYVAQRMTGFGGESQRAIPQDFTDWPEFAAARIALAAGRGAKITNAPQAVAEVRYDDLASAEQECDLIERHRTVGDFVEYFMSAASPGIIATTMHNAYYDSYEAYVFALAREMRKEYKLIVDRGFVLQIDAPDLAMERTMMFRDRPMAEFLDAVRLHIAALNEALEGIPAEKVRLHCCWGNWEGPHAHDVPLEEVLPLLYEAKVGALSIPLANPRHQHEYEVFKRLPLPDGLILIAGVIDPTTSFIEHPEVVAERVLKAVSVVGDRERVIAGTDCGFSTFAGYGFAPEEIVWAKMKALADGAAVASRRLWS